MNVEVTCSGQVVTAKLVGDIDHHSAKYIREKIDSALMVFTPETLVLDFTRVPFMDSSGIGLVMGRFATLSKTGGKIKIKGVNSSIYKVMKLATLDKIATIEKRGEEVHS